MSMSHYRPTLARFLLLDQDSERLSNLDKIDVDFNRLTAYNFKHGRAIKDWVFQASAF